MSFFFWELFSVIIAGNHDQHDIPGIINNCNVMIGAALPWKARIFRLQLQFFSPCCVWELISCCNVTLYALGNNFVPNGIDIITMHVTQTFRAFNNGRDSKHQPQAWPEPSFPSVLLLPGQGERVPARSPGALYVFFAAIFWQQRIRPHGMAIWMCTVVQGASAYFREKDLIDRPRAFMKKVMLA